MNGLNDKKKTIQDSDSEWSFSEYIKRFFLNLFSIRFFGYLFSVYNFLVE